MAEIILLPIRHHSPACAWHVKKTIEQLIPDRILVEGPCNADAMIPVMVHEDTKAPFAVYYSYRDSAGGISESRGHYKCYYPFLDYSPELVALREGTKAGARVSFIDLPYGEILAASKEGKGLRREEEKPNYNDDYLLSRNQYWERLCEKTGLRSFDEFWEKYFEINGIREDSRTWFSHLLSYCTLARQDTPGEVLEEEGCLKREAFMAEQILKAAGEKEAKKVLVVTGGFHTPGLQKLISKGQGRNGPEKRRIPAEDQEVYLMPYSMEAADALNGYASGMPFPGFYQKIWEKLPVCERPYEEAVYDLLVTAGKECQRKEGGLSTYDEICACNMADGLAALREKAEPGAYELLDAVLSSYVKGEHNLSTDAPLEILRRQMTGKRMGKLCDSAQVPPIIRDFEKQCQKFGLKFRSAMESEVTLSIFSMEKHRRMSIFFHRLSFLDTAFAKRIKGPNLQLGRDKNLIREIWKYKWSTQVTAALIDVSVHGATVEEAAAGIVKERLKKELDAKGGALLLTQVFEMGLKEQLWSVFQRMEELILKDSDFYSLSEALRLLCMVEQLRELYQSGLDVETLITACCQKLLILLPSMTGIRDEELEKCMNVLKLLYQITGRMEGRERESYEEALLLMLQDEKIHPGLDGCIYGLLFGCRRVDAEAVERACRGYLTGTREQMLKTAQFFRGLFFTARDLVFVGKNFAGMLDSFLGQVNEEEFLELLPELRMAFGYFMPREIDRIAQKAADLHGMGGQNLLKRQEVLPDWYRYGKELDEYAKKRMGSNLWNGDGYGG